MPLGAKTLKNLVSFRRAPPTKRKSGGIPKEGQAPLGLQGGGGGGRHSPHGLFDFTENHRPHGKGLRWF